MNCNACMQRSKRVMMKVEASTFRLLLRGNHKYTDCFFPTVHIQTKETDKSLFQLRSGWLVRTPALLTSAYFNGVSCMFDLTLRQVANLTWHLFIHFLPDGKVYITSNPMCDGLLTVACVIRKRTRSFLRWAVAKVRTRTHARPTPCRECVWSERTAMLMMLA